MTGDAFDDRPRQLLERYVATPIRCWADYQATLRQLVGELAACDRSDRRMLLAYMHVIAGMQRLAEFRFGFWQVPWWWRWAAHDDRR